MSEAVLNERDWLTLSEVIHRLHDAGSLTDLAATMLEAVRELIPCEYSSYDEVDLANRQTVGVCSNPEVDRRWPALEEAVVAHFHEHPVLHFFKDHPEAGPRRISDFLKPERFRETGLYRDCYRHLDVEHQLVLRLPGRAGTEVGIALNRHRRDFSERDRRCLSLLRPHMHQAYRQCLATLRLREQALGAALAAESTPHGVIVLDALDRPMLCTRRARKQLARYFPHDVPMAGRLPDLLDRWVRELNAATDRGTLCPNPLVIEAEDGRLTITAIHHDTPGAWVLCLEEASLTVTLRSFRGLGLTHRQAQVLYWVTQGKTNPETATILGVSPRTVQKHLEHIFQILGVETRTMATVKAMEALRNTGR